jgi:hypothetical protein
MSLIEGVRRFTQRIGPGYSRTAIDELQVPCNYNRLYHLCLLHVLGSHQQAIVDGLQTLRGSLCKGLLSEDDCLIGTNHGSEYVTLHLSAIYYQLASVYLDELPPISAIEDWDATRLGEAIAGLDNSSAWYASNIIMSYAVLFAHNVRRGKNPDCLPAIIGFLNDSQNAATGLWFSTTRASKINAMAATFHYLPLYSYLHTTPHHAHKMFDSIALLANHNGFFNLPSGYACLDYDGISSLQFLFERALSDRERETRLHTLLSVATALRTHLLAMQHDDGGFPEAGPSQGTWADVAHWISHVLRNRCFWSAAWNARFILKSWSSPNRLIHANSVLACRARISESNAFSTWFRYMTIACCEDIIERNGTLTHREAPRRKLDLPGLGYF